MSKRRSQTKTRPRHGMPKSLKSQCTSPGTRKHGRCASHVLATLENEGACLSRGARVRSSAMLQTKSQRVPLGPTRLAAIRLGWPARNGVTNPPAVLLRCVLSDRKPMGGNAFAVAAAAMRAAACHKGTTLAATESFGSRDRFIDVAQMAHSLAKASWVSPQSSPIRPHFGHCASEIGSKVLTHRIRAISVMRVLAASTYAW
eukprot:CAMPEP_0198514210 /NCGR_PEP_ID=MMETSP1462-20131121/16553_1 /TAXON_ID=1333877 /ORGANISM="Brandtodinium nutriculum, Strain RCC3387" /LENGTH=201 /DNA_ID=CAMNT_0044243659 /DNA_START=27 /DNA_END=632 /DNA_ORIENTATION=-